MVIDSIIFDVDGTLWDATDVVADAWNTAIRDNTTLSLTINGPILKNLFGKTLDEIAGIIFKDEPKDRQLDLMDLCCNYENEYLKTRCGALYPDLERVLHTLCQRYPLYIVSNCQAGYIESFLAATGFASYFKDHLCPGDTGEGKAYNIREIIRRNHLNAPIYVGDTTGDYNAVKEADPSMPFVFAAYGFGEVSNPEYTISCPSELLNFF